MKKWVKLDRDLTVRDMGKNVRLRNGMIDTLKTIADREDNYPIETNSELSLTIDGKFYKYSYDYDMFDIVEIEEHLYNLVQKEGHTYMVTNNGLVMIDESYDFSFTAPKDCDMMIMRQHGYKITIEKE